MDRLSMQGHAHQTQQQRARHNKHKWRNFLVDLERAAFHHDPEIDYSADKSVTNTSVNLLDYVVQVEK